MEAGLRIKDLAKSLRPRERLISNGKEAMTDAELLAVILQTGTKNYNALQLSSYMLSMNSLEALSRLSYSRLLKIKGIGPAKALKLIACFELAARIRQKSPGQAIKSSEDAYSCLLSFSKKEKEHFIALMLNSRKRLIRKKIVFIGTLDSALIHPREIFKEAISNSAAAIVIAHNHPSGSASPSTEDIEITKQLYSASKIIGIELLDHIIISSNGFFSFRDNGLVF